MDGESASINLAGANLELYDDSGAFIQSGVAANNVSNIQFVDSTTDGGATSYFVRVLGQDTDYSLQVYRNGEFDVEPNDSGATAIDLTDRGGVFGHIALEVDLEAEPDNFAAGSVIDNSFVGITLSNPDIGGSVFAASASFGAPTGSNVFAPGPSSASGWREGDNSLRVDFDIPQSFVSIDVGSDDASDIGFLEAYDASGTLLQRVESIGVAAGGSDTISITRGSNDIAYVVAAGVGGDITPLDNLRYVAAGSDDVYSLDVNSGDLIDFSAILPGDGPNFIDNGLDLGTASDLTMTLLDPSGTPVASGVDSLVHTAGTTGTYTIVVASNGGSGEYFLGRNDDVVVINGIDFGAAGTPLWPGFVAQADEPYSANRGYGWLSSTGLAFIENQRGNDLIRDRAVMRNGDFAIDVADGTYNVDVFLGIVRKIDAIQISIEGTPDTFVPLAGPNVVRSYVATVTDGQLNFGFDGLAGLDNRIFIAGIELTEAGGRSFSSNGKSDPISNAAGSSRLPVAGDLLTNAPSSLDQDVINPRKGDLIGSLSGSLPANQLDDVFAGLESEILLAGQEFDLQNELDSDLIDLR